MRRIFYILLLLCLPLHGFAMQGGLPHAAESSSRLHELEHELEHAEGVYHHHHEGEGLVHYDQSDQSVEHVQDHSCSPHPAGFSLPALIVPPEQQVSKLAPFVADAVPEPFLDGPRKPPRLALGQAAGGKPHI